MNIRTVGIDLAKLLICPKFDPGFAPISDPLKFVQITAFTTWLVCKADQYLMQINSLALKVIYGISLK